MAGERRHTAGTGGPGHPPTGSRAGGLGTCRRRGRGPTGRHSGTTGERSTCFLAGTRRGCEPRPRAGAALSFAAACAPCPPGCSCAPGKVQGPGQSPESTGGARDTGSLGAKRGRDGAATFLCGLSPSSPGALRVTRLWRTHQTECPGHAGPSVGARTGAAEQGQGLGPRTGKCPAVLELRGPFPSARGSGSGGHIPAPLRPAGDRRRRGR